MARKKPAQQRSQAINENLQAYQRMNFLYQAAMLMTTMNPEAAWPGTMQVTTQTTTQTTTQATTQTTLQTMPQATVQTFVAPMQSNPGSPLTKLKKKPAYWSRDANSNLVPLGRFYVNSMKTVGKRLVLRLDPNIKRTVCKRCETLLVPYVTARVRIESHPVTRTTTTCAACATRKQFLARPDFALFTERPEAMAGWTVGGEMSGFAFTEEEREGEGKGAKQGRNKGKRKEEAGNDSVEGN